MNILFNNIIRRFNLSYVGDFNLLEKINKNLILDIRSNRLTYLPKSRLASIAKTCQEIETQNLPGIMIEAGCALGGSAILIALIKNKKRFFYIYDVFDIIPPPSKMDGEDVQRRYQIIKDGKSKGLYGNKYYGYEDNLFEIVRKNFKQFNINEKNDHVKLVKGMLQDTMKINQPVSFAHIDVDWYEPVKVSLERIVPKLIVGGSVILDDYNDWSGCHKATEEYFKKISGKFKMDDSAGSMKITRLTI